MTIRDLYLICFAAAAVIHGAQTVLAAKLLRHRRGSDREAVINAIAMGVLAFLWQFGNFLVAFASTASLDGVAPGSDLPFWIGNLRDSAFVSFPLFFSYMCLRIPDTVGRGARRLVQIGRYLRYPLWPWTAFAVVAMTAANSG